MTLAFALEMLGVAVFAASGVLAAGRKGLDLIGVVVIAVVTAVGGGTLRDLLLDRPIAWIVDPRYLYAILAGALVTLLYVRVRRPPGAALEVADALGLALFALGGAQIAERAGVPAIVVVIMGTMTGVAGGVLRDVLTAEIPMILREGRMYATAAIAGVALYLALQHAGVPPRVALLAGMACVAGLRLAAIAWNLTIPVFRLPDDDAPAAPAPVRAARGEEGG